MATPGPPALLVDGVPSLDAIRRLVAIEKVQVAGQMVDFRMMRLTGMSTNNSYG